MIPPDVWKRAGPAVALATALPFFTIGGGALGAGLDRLVGTGIGFTVLGALLGFAAAVYQLFRGTQQQQTPSDDPPHDPPP